jgi:CO/xanthine dehydrogenase Mo-binding subunit
MSSADLVRLALEQNQGAITHLSVYEPARAPITSFAAQVAEVEVDPGTGQVIVRKLTTVHDSGTVLNHLSYTGQIDGGVVTGLGFALMEDSSLVDGKIAATNLGEFKMATVADLPKLTTVLMENPAGPIPYQGKAIAEIPNVPTAAAIANAIHDAVGVRLYDLPLTAEKIYAALHKA